MSFKLSVKNKTGKSQRVRDKTYKVVNLISRCASIISMDISMDLFMDIHIHGKPGSYGRRSFSVAGPATWNSLPRHLRDPVHMYSSFWTITQDILLLRVLLRIRGCFAHMVLRRCRVDALYIS